MQQGHAMYNVWITSGAYNALYAIVPVMNLYHEAFRVHAAPVPGSVLFDVTLYQRTGEKIHVASFEKGDVILTEQPIGEDFKPTFRIPINVLHEITAAFVQYAREKKMPEPTKDFAEGELTATKKHLEDMRKLVFEEKVVIEGRPIQD